jgi:hypothetical protein
MYPRELVLLCSLLIAHLYGGTKKCFAFEGPALRIYRQQRLLFGLRHVAFVNYTLTDSRAVFGWAKKG